MVTGTEFIEDIRKAPEDELSFISATKEVSSKFVALRYLMASPSFQLAPSAKYLGQSHSVAMNFHEVLVTYITRNLPFIVPDIRDETISVFNDAMAAAISENSSGTGSIQLQARGHE